MKVILSVRLSVVGEVVLHERFPQHFPNSRFDYDYVVISRVEEDCKHWPPSYMGPFKACDRTAYLNEVAAFLRRHGHNVVISENEKGAQINEFYSE